MRMRGEREPFAFRLDPTIRPRMGLIVLRTDETVEGDARRLMGAGSDLYATRVESAADVTTATLSAMEMRLPEAARLLPDAAPFDVIGYGCTSASAVIGPARVADLVR